ncbi:transposase [Pseudomonas fluorescens]|nr:transposase [Pseudomonas fluorescens]
MAKQYELSDASWGMVEDLITQHQKMGRPRYNHRLMFNGILWALCSVAAWRDMLEQQRADAEGNWTRQADAKITGRASEREVEALDNQERYQSSSISSDEHSTEAVEVPRPSKP